MASAGDAVINSSAAAERVANIIPCLRGKRVWTSIRMRLLLFGLRDSLTLMCALARGRGGKRSN